MDIQVTCSTCHSNQALSNIDMKDWKRFINGELVQNVWPELSVDEREILIGKRTGHHTCSTCWDVLFTEEN